jgi:hypothetical protein
MADGDFVRWESNSILPDAAHQVGHTAVFPRTLQTPADTHRRPFREPAQWFPSPHVFLVENGVKPPHRRVEGLPSALCEAQTQVEEDLLVMQLEYRERPGEIDVLRHSPEHRGYHVPQMDANQAILLETCDSETDGRARFMGHTAFDDPTTPPGAMKRESIKVRTMAFF